MATIPTITLNDGRPMPRLGLGVWQISDAEAVPAVHAALEAGYRLIDTAAIYGNEQGIGEAIRSSGVPREELFVTTKVWNDRHGYDATLRAMDESLGRLGLDAVDLYLIHWPVPGRGLYAETWRALVTLRDRGLAKSIGVSNFNVPHLRRLIDETGVVPAVNQIELHPQLQQAELRAFHAEHGIVTESWSPLARGGLLENEVVRWIAAKHGKTPAQVVLRWHVENGLVVIPKSVTPARIRENADVFDFRLDADDMTAIATLDAGRRIGPDPEVFS